jgi:hypothetical protein
MDQVEEAPAKLPLVFWLPPAEAALRFGVTRDELTRRVRSGEVTMRAKVAGGELVATLCSTDLIAVFGPPVVGARRAPKVAPGDAEVKRLHGELVIEREAVRLLDLDRARLEGQLETAGRVERGLQRYADKLETKLEAAETLRLNLARAVGQLEAEAARLQARLAAAQPPPRQLEAPARPKKRRWFRR